MTAGAVFHTASAIIHTLASDRYNPIPALDIVMMLLSLGFRRKTFDVMWCDMI